MRDVYASCEKAVLEGDRKLARELAEKALGGGYDVLQTIEHGFSAGIRKAGELWEKGEYFLPELALSAEAMKAAMDVFQPALLEKAGNDSRGVVVIGTVQGDIHDIGKTFVATLLSANGYRVIDLGADVPFTRFLEEASSHQADFVCMSALLTTTLPGQRRVIELFERDGPRKKVKFVVGGAPASSAWARDIGADGYGSNAVEAVQVLNHLSKLK